MKQKLKMTMIVACLCLTGAGTVNAQWVVSDPGNLAQSVINSTKETAETTGMKTNMLNGFLETREILQQGKKYYDVLKPVHGVVEGGMKVSKSTSLVMEIPGTCVDNYRCTLSDENYAPRESATVSSDCAMLIDESSDVLQDLRNVVNVTGMSPLDVERLAIIKNAYRSLVNYYSLVRYYTNKTISVGYLRTRKKSGMDRVMSLCGTANRGY